MTTMRDRQSRHRGAQPMFYGTGAYAQSQVGNGAIQFRVVDATTGQIIPTVQVVLLNLTTGDHIQSTINGGDLVDVPQGSYSIVLDAAGYVGVTATPVPQPVQTFSILSVELEPLPLVANVQVAVRSAQTGLPIQGASVSGNGVPATALTDQAGTATVALSSGGNVNITATAAGYRAVTATTVAVVGQTVFVSVSLTPTGGGGGGGGTTATVNVSVHTPQGAPVGGAQVTLAGVSAVADANGLATFALAQGGTYALAVSATGYQPFNSTVTVANSETKAVPVVLSPSGGGGGGGGGGTPAASTWLLALLASGAFAYALLAE